MKIRNLRIVFIAILLLVSVGNFFRISAGAASIRTVDFLSIFVIGVLSGLLIGIIAFTGRKE